MSGIGRDDARAAPGPLLGSGVRVGADVSFGAYVVVHDGTVIGEGCAIEDHAVLGKRPRLAGHSLAHGDVGALELGAGAAVGTGAVVFAGARVGAGTILGDQCFVRERALIGERAVIGRGSVVDNDVRVGARVRVQTNVYLTAFTHIEDDVFIGPGVCTTNDDTMARHGPRPPASARRCGARAGSAAASCSPPAWRSARRRSWRPARWSRGTCRRARS